MTGWSPMSRTWTIGCMVLAVFTVLAALIFYADRLFVSGRQYLLLATVNSRYGLEVGSPVFYQGVQIGQVIMIKPPEPDNPGYKLRMAVEKNAFQHISLDAPVRIESAGAGKPWLVNILPGKTRPEPGYPGKVKVLQEITPLEIKVRAVQDILQGLIDLSEAKSREGEVEDLKQELEKLRGQLKGMNEPEKE